MGFTKTCTTIEKQRIIFCTWVFSYTNSSSIGEIIGRTYYIIIKFIVCFKSIFTHIAFVASHILYFFFNWLFFYFIKLSSFKLCLSKNSIVHRLAKNNSQSLFKARIKSFLYSFLVKTYINRENKGVTFYINWLY